MDFNLFTYANQNPVNDFDPDGRRRRPARGRSNRRYRPDWDDALEWMSFWQSATCQMRANDIVSRFEEHMEELASSMPVGCTKVCVLCIRVIEGMLGPCPAASYITCGKRQEASARRESGSICYSREVWGREGLSCPAECPS